jgi:uncharacterized protein with FMN-binding domain
MEECLLKKKRAILYVIIAIVLVAAIFFVGGKAYLEKTLETLAAMTISNVDLTNAKDGEYTGGYGSFPVAAEVRVTINNGRITQIELTRHQNGQGSAAEVIPSLVLQAGTLEIDSVTGATYSSKVILKSIEIALQKALQ